MQYSNTPAPTPLTFERFPTASCRSATVTFAAAGALRLRNHAANELEPPRSRYSRSVKHQMVTYTLPTLWAPWVVARGNWSGRHMSSNVPAAFSCPHSPLRYQKQLRLQEARQLMLNEHLDVCSAGGRVGYKSPSQFSREYSRLFGAPPQRDVSACGCLALPTAHLVAPDRRPQLAENGPRYRSPRPSPSSRMAPMPRLLSYNWSSLCS